MQESVLFVGQLFGPEGSPLGGLLVPLAIIAIAALGAHLMVRSARHAYASPAASARDRAIASARQRMVQGELTPEDFARIADLLRT